MLRWCSPLGLGENFLENIPKERINGDFRLFLNAARHQRFDFLGYLLAQRDPQLIFSMHAYEITRILEQIPLADFLKYQLIQVQWLLKIKLGLMQLDKKQTVETLSQYLIDNYFKNQ